MVSWRFDNQRLNLYSSLSSPKLENMKVLFIVGSLSISGGTNYIFEHAKALQDAGAEVTLGHLLGKTSDGKWHPHFSALASAPYSDLENQYFDLVIVTWWPTVYELHRVKFARVLYFVQSIESRFNYEPRDAKSGALAAGTYFAGIPVITIASYIQSSLMSLTGKPVWLVRNGIDRNQFPLAEVPTRGGKAEGKRLRVLVEGFGGAPMKAVGDSIDALVDLKPQIEIWHVSPTIGGGSLKADRVFEKVKLDKMHEIYEKIDVLVKMSRVEGMFGPPLEAFHAGATAVVAKVSGFDEYIRDGVNSLAVEIDDFEAMRNAIINLAEDRELLAGLKQGALITAENWISMPDSHAGFVSACRAVLASPHFNSQDILTNIAAIRQEIFQLEEDGQDPRKLFPPAFTDVDS